MKKIKYKYMHTIDVRPARFSEKDNQICFLNTYGHFIGKLVPTLDQIDLMVPFPALLRPGNPLTQ